MSRPYRFLLIALMIVGAAGCGSAARTQVALGDEPDTLPDEISAKSKEIPESTVKSETEEQPAFYFRQAEHSPSKTGIIQTGRYTAIVPAPTPEQKHILDVVITVTLPKGEVQTVGQGIRYLLRRSGYQMVKPDKLPPDALWLFSNPLPSVHRQLGPITLKDAINTLASPAFVLVEDPMHRLISFQLSPNIVMESLQ